MEKEEKKTLKVRVLRVSAQVFEFVDGEQPKVIEVKHLCDLYPNSKCSIDVEF